MVEIPVAIVLAAITLVASLTFLEDEPLDPFAEGAEKTLFLTLILLAAQLLFAQVARGAATVMAAAIAGGRTLSPIGALDPAFNRMGGLLALALITALAGATLLIPIFGLLIAGYLAVRLGLGVEALMLEGANPFRALARSWMITHRRATRLFVVLLLAALSVIPAVVGVSLVGLLVTGSRTQQVIAGALVTVTQGVLIVPVVAFFSAATTLFYLQATGNRDVLDDV
jgi:hypothetical protein